MFPEYHEQISQLKISDTNFARLYEKHNLLDHKISQMETLVSPSTRDELEQLKKEKLLIKDTLYNILKKADGDRQ